MEKYDPNNPNNLEDILKENKKEIKEKKDIGNKEAKVQSKDIGMNILQKMGWKGKGIKILKYIINFVIKYFLNRTWEK